MTLRRVALVLVFAASPAPVAAQERACATAPALPPESLVALGRFWHAEQAAAPLPRAPRPVELPLGLLHARIRAGLGRWSEVEEVLRRVRRGDTVPEVVALEAEAAEHLRNWPAAEAGYRRLALLPSAGADLRSRAVVRRALALEMLGRDDAAVAAWRAAAQGVPEIADWFAIHRAERERDTLLAFASVAASRSPGAALHADLFVAQRRLDAGNAAGALEVYRRRDRQVDVARAEFVLGDDRAARAHADSVLLRDPTKPQAVLAANLLQAQGVRLTPAELAGVARAYRSQNDLPGATRALRQALGRADTSVGLWLELSALLAERRDRRGALASIDSAARRIRGRGVGAEVAARIAVARVNALAALRSWDAADTELARTVDRFPGDTAVARGVLRLAEHDRATMQPESEEARYRLLLDRFPAAPAANVARFRMALALYVRDRRDAAATVLAEVLSRDTAEILGTGPRYWHARIRFEGGDTLARAALQRIAVREPLSYYGVRSRNLLREGLDFVADSEGPGSDAGAYAPGRAAERIRLLEMVGFDQEARDEALGWIGDPSAPARLLAGAADAAVAAGLGREAIRLGETARSRGGLSWAVARSLLPFPYRAVIEGEAAEECLDPLLLAAIIRQESYFTPRAVSRAGARGIAQVLPSTGRWFARSLRIRGWDPALLFVPDFNLHLGVRIMVQRIHGESFPVYAAIAAYNAGAPRVDRWRAWPEFRDPDLFVERVAITETRNYVKNVYASYQWYRRTYAP